MELLRRVLDEEDPLDAYTVYTTQFICLSCEAIKKPVAIKPGMKLSPHFRLQGEHESGCDVDGYEQLVKSEQKRPVSSPTGFPVPYPNKLRLPILRRVTDSSTSQAPLVTKHSESAFI